MAERGEQSAVSSPVAAKPAAAKKVVPQKPEHHIPWLTLFFVVLAVGAIFMSANSSYQQVLPTTLGITSSSEAIVPQSVSLNSMGSAASQDQLLNGVMAPTAAQMPSNQGTYSSSGMAPAGIRIAPPGYPHQQDYYYSYGEATVKDTREFNKVQYGATMRSRDVQPLTRRVETTVRGNGGRVDNTQSSPEEGFVSFVVPADKFDAFRDELESLVDSRFLSINISSQNLLPQKQNIETQQTNVQDSLSNMQATRATLVSSHTSTLNSLQSKRAALVSEAKDLNLEATLTSTSTARYHDIVTRLQQIGVQQRAYDNQIASENAAYTQQLAMLDQNISYQNQNLSNVQKQDQNLLDNVATVNGTVSIRWISLWDLVQLYIPGWGIAGILIICAVIAQLWHRRRLHELNTLVPLRV